ncbi:hypothetical protein [Jannaschia formosa]|uniref:hypothetical protein n=1 Tax=Jannaschia formosa TaxID=2259592 RepID=UPI000E1C1560|nr:hypothetical protein [Jannaschia formosa]TFL17464.1 hypothetical protein DR046_14770 [Jannaschia formosa]
MKRAGPALALALCLAQAAQAQQIGDCDSWQASARNVDWSDPTRTFANDEVRLVGLRTGEPASAAFHILLTFPHPEDPVSGCHLISAGEGLGYGSISLRRATARYDSLRGLTIGVPGTDPAGDPVLIEFVLNRTTGEVTLP